MSGTISRQLETKNLWKLILALHKTKVFSAAARQVGLSVSSASKLLSNFEDATGITLLDRRFRPAQATKELESLVPTARRMLSAIEETESAVRALQQEASGSRIRGRVIRIALPINVRNDRALASILEYARQNPGLRLSFYGDECYNRLVRGEAEIAQFGFFPDNPDIHAEYIRTNGFFILASREFISSHGRPESVEDLKNFPIAIRNPTNRSFSRRLEKGTQSFFIPEGPNIIYADTTTCAALLRTGQAIALDVSIGSVLPELKSGDVVPILNGWHRKPNDTYVCCQAKNADDPVIRDIMDIIKKTIREEQSDNWEKWAQKFGIPTELLKSSM